MKREDIILGIVYLNIVLYATCFQIQRPLEPFLVDKLSSGNSVNDYAKLNSFFSLVQTVGSFMSGPFLDKFGPKIGFLITFISSAMSYWLLSISTTLDILYLSKIPTIFQAGFLCAQLSASLVTKDGADRIKALGRVTMSYTIGSVMGPAIGGWLGASGDYYYGAKLAVYGSLLSAILTLFLPDFDHSNSKIDNKSNDIPKNTNKAHSYGFINVFSSVWLFLCSKVITSVANATSASAMPLILKNIYHLNEQNLGLVMSAMSACNAVVNGLFLAPIVAVLGNGSLIDVIKYCVLAMSILSFTQAFMGVDNVISVISYTNGLLEYVVLLFVLSVLQFVLSTTITSESTSRVNSDEKGTLLGLEHSLFAAARIVTPQIGVYLLNEHGVSGVCSACGGIFLGVYCLWVSFIGRFDRGFDDKHTIASNAGGERKEK